jgi:nitroreductase
VIRRIVKVIHRAPSAGFSQGHRLIVLTDPVPRKRIAELCEPSYTESGWPPWISLAPVASLNKRRLPLTDLVQWR